VTSIDYTTAAGQVRLLIADVASNPADRLLEDDQVLGFLAMNGDSVRLAAADALDAIASSETLVSKAIRTQDLATDGPKVATDLRSHATRLRTLAAADDGDSVFDVVYPAPSLRPAQLEQEVWGL
jgi:hypothetical protein